jgi:hypothetical protein
MAQPEGKRGSLGWNLLGTLLGAVVGAAAILIGGAQATAAAHNSDQAQAQLQVETTRRTVYAEFVAAAADVCTTLSVRPFDESRTDSAVSAFVGKGAAVALVAPSDVMDAAQKVNDYLVDATSGPDGASAPAGCENEKFFSLVNEFIDVAKTQLSYQ